MFIYKITNLINHKQYVGQTTRSLKLRFKKQDLQHSKLKPFQNNPTSAGG
jgi:hypothetical protein